MTKQEMVVLLGNAIIMLNMVETKGEKNLNALLSAMQQVKKVNKALKEENNVDKNEHGGED